MCIKRFYKIKIKRKYLSRAAARTGDLKNKKRKNVINKEVVCWHKKYQQQ